MSDYLQQQFGPDRKRALITGAARGIGPGDRRSI